VHLVGFTTEIYHDARSYKRQWRILYSRMWHAVRPARILCVHTVPHTYLHSHGCHLSHTKYQTASGLHGVNGVNTHFLKPSGYHSYIHHHVYSTDTMFFFGLCPSLNIFFNMFRKPALFLSSGKEAPNLVDPLDIAIFSLSGLPRRERKKKARFPHRQSPAVLNQV
jgi:hypothetical protein